jgi:hypothetical protein
VGVVERRNSTALSQRHAVNRNCCDWNRAFHSRIESHIAKSPAEFLLRGFSESWRRGWDSNPRYGETVRLISSQVHSTTLPPLRDTAFLLPLRYWSATGEAKIIEHFLNFSSLLSRKFRGSENSHVPERRRGAVQDAASRRATPPMYGRSASGTVTEPSAFWKFSSTATSVRPTASPEPFSVCTRSGLPCALR